ncbi:MAG: hypothetical protein ACSHW0_02870 [Thalassotalea sp.]
MRHSTKYTDGTSGKVFGSATLGHNTQVPAVVLLHFERVKLTGESSNNFTLLSANKKSIQV